MLAVSYLPRFISALFFSFPICSLFQQAGLGGLHQWLSCPLYSDRFSPQDPLQEIRMWEENGLRVFSFTDSLSTKSHLAGCHLKAPVLKAICSAWPSSYPHRKREQFGWSWSCVCACAQRCLTLQPHELCSPPGSPVHGNFQERIVEWVGISYSRGSSQSRNWTHVSCISCTARQILCHCTLILYSCSIIHDFYTFCSHVYQVPLYIKPSMLS